jgi:hypothetical protein
MTYDVVTSTDYDVVIAAEPNDDVQVQLDFEIVTIDVPDQGPPGPAGAPGAPGTPGNTVMHGSGPPSSAMGRDGDWYIDTNTHTIYGPKASGIWPTTGTSLVGPQGPQGITGVNGNTILYGVGAPSNSLGVDGNFYIDTSAHTMYGPKAGGVWPAGTSLIGPQGPIGQRGSQWYEGAGAPGTIAGALANDNFLNTTNGDVYNYSGSSWGSPVGNIRGPAGLTGPPGSTTVTISPTAPASPVDNQIWWNSTNGQFYVRYNDGTSTQWVAATPLIDTTNLVQKSGDTMTGPLVLPADPTASMQASTKQYVDNQILNTPYTIVESHASNAVTFSLKTLAGLDATATTPIYMTFKNGTGGVVTRAITGPLSITIPAAATIGIIAGFGYRVWIAAFDDAGTVRLAVRTCQYCVSGTYAIQGVDEALAASSLAPVGNNVWQFYTSVAVTSKFWKWVAYANYEAANGSLSTPGNWTTSPNTIEIVTGNTPRPGSTIATYRNQTQTVDSVSTTTVTLIGPSFTWTLQSTCNLLLYQCDGYIYLRTGGTNGQGSITSTRNGSNINSAGPNFYQAASTDAITSYCTAVIDKPPAGANTFRLSAHNATAALVQYAINSTTFQELMG